MPSYALVMPFRPAFDSNAVPIPGAKAVLSVNPGTTLATIYSDSALTIPTANPVIANAAGRFPRVYLDTAVTYRLRIFDADDDITTATPIEDFAPYNPVEVGAAGPTGASAVAVTIGTTTTGAAGTNASVANSGTPTNPVLDFTIPRGNTGASGALSDGDFGDISVSSSGTVLTIDPGVVTLAKMANLAEDRVIGRQSAGAGVPEALTIGVGAAADIPDRAAGDTRWIQQTSSRSYEIFIPASAMKARTTSGAAAGATETATNRINFDTFDFDQTTTEYVQFHWQMPKSWNEGTVTMRPIWTASGGSAAQTCIFGFQGVALSDDDAIDTAFGTVQTSSDALIATGDAHVGPYSAAITIGGSPAESDWVVFQVYRDTSDTLAADAKLIGVTLKITVNAQDDS